MKIYVAGSMAFDRIMDFPDKFSNHILPDKIHNLNVCFVVNGMEEKFGGTAGNIAYSLALLNERPHILSTVGKDFSPYEKWLRKLDLPLDGIRFVTEEFTAGAYITTDKADNQITGFNPGALKHPSRAHIDRSNLGGSYGIVSPGNIEDMTDYPETFKKLNIPYIFDPGQQITALTGEQMTKALTGAALLVTNDYELAMIMKSTGLTEEEIIERVDGLITTLGAEGSRVIKDGKTTHVGSVPATEVKDPTGAGDSYRAGLLKGLTSGKDLVQSCQMGATCAAYCVEQYGTQIHTFTQEEFWTRYKGTFGDPS